MSTITDTSHQLTWFCRLYWAVVTERHEIAFMRAVSHGVEGLALAGWVHGDVAARIQAAFERAVRTHLHRAEAGDPTSACSAAPVDLDFANSSAVTRCTHYDEAPPSSSQSAEQEVRARF